MDRRKFLLAIAGGAGATAVVGRVRKADAAPLIRLDGDEATAEGFFRKLGEESEPKAETVQYYYYRRRRRWRCWYVRRWYGYKRRCGWF